MKNILTLITLLIFINARAQSNSDISHLADSLEKELKLSKEDTTKVNILVALGNEYNKTKAEKSLQLGKLALQLATKLNFLKGIGNSETLIGYGLKDLSKYDEALMHFEKAIAVFQKTGNKLKLADVYGIMGWIYRNQGKDPEALANYDRALQISVESGDQISIAASYNDIGSFHFYKGNYPEALNNHFKSLKIREKEGNKKLMAGSYNNIGMVYMQQKNEEEALKNYFKALKINIENGNKKWMQINYNNIGVTYYKQGNFPEALKNHFEALKLRKEMGDKKGIASSYNNIGVVYEELGNLNEALTNQLAALEIKLEIGNKQDISSAYNNLGSLYLKLRKNNDTKLSASSFLKAKEYLEKSIELSKNIGDKEGLKLAYKHFTKLDSSEAEEAFARGNWKLSAIKLRSSLEHYIKFTIYRDSLWNEENVKKITQSGMQFEFEKKEALTKAEQEKKDVLTNAELKRQKLLMNSTIGGIGIIGIFSFFLVRSSNRKKKTVFEKQVSEVEMKALRSQMNPHFIFNALQSVNDFILKKDTMNASNFLIKFSKLMRAVLENSVHKEVTIEKDIASLELYMQLESSRLDIPFDYEIVIDPKIDPEITFIPPLILQPFVENSIWHGLKHRKEKGKIKIEIKEENNSIVCSIEDNGVGREKANTLKQPVTGKRESLGMKLTKERLRILEKIKNFRSRIDVIDLKDALNNPLGLRVELSLPLATLN